MCGPFCSVPPIGTMIVVFPDWIRSCSSVQVSSSRNTVSEACAAGMANARRNKSRDALAIYRWNIGDDGGGHRAEDHDEPRGNRPECQQQKGHYADHEIGRSENGARPDRPVERR